MTPDQFLLAYVEKTTDTTQLLHLGAIYHRILDLELQDEVLFFNLEDEIGNLIQFRDWVHSLIPWFSWTLRSWKLYILYEDIDSLINEMHNRCQDSE